MDRSKNVHKRVEDMKMSILVEDGKILKVNSSPVILTAPDMRVEYSSGDDLIFTRDATKQTFNIPYDLSIEALRYEVYAMSMIVWDPEHDWINFGAKRSTDGSQFRDSVMNFSFRAFHYSAQFAPSILSINSTTLTGGYFFNSPFIQNGLQGEKTLKRPEQSGQKVPSTTYVRDVYGIAGTTVRIKLVIDTTDWKWHLFLNNRYLGYEQGGIDVTEMNSTTATVAWLRTITKNVHVSPSHSQAQIANLIIGSVATWDEAVAVK